MALSTRPKFKLGENVQLALSKEKGVIVGRAEYSDSVPGYLIRYVAADGRQTECWFKASEFVVEGKTDGA